MNPYKELNVPIDATEDEIKKSFRDLSKIHHPDAGGAKEKFAQINDAYMILKDPVKRQYYDTHGAEAPKSDPIIDKAMNLFSQMVIDIINYYEDGIIYENIIKIMTDGVKSELKQVDNELKTCTKGIDLCDKQLKIFKKKLKFKQEKAKTNMFEYIIQEKIHGINQQSDKIKNHQAVLNTVLDWLSDFEFDFEKKTFK